MRWKPAADNGSGVGAYSIYRDGSFLCTVPDRKYVDRKADTETSHIYEVSAVDRTGNEGPKSEGIPTMVDDETPPILFNPVVNEQRFSIQAAARPHSIAITVNVPELLNVPATISLFTLNGRLLGRILTNADKNGRYTAEFKGAGCTGVHLCRIQAGKYNEQIRILNVK